MPLESTNAATVDSFGGAGMALYYPYCFQSFNNIPQERVEDCQTGSEPGQSLYFGLMGK
jgi:hypothetical protein